MQRRERERGANTRARVDGESGAAVPTLAAAAGVTSTIVLGTFVSSPNYRHPYTFARDVLTLDDLSGGRFLCGLGTGGDLDARILGEDRTLKERVDRFHEFVPLLDRLLREDRVDHEGAWFTSRGARTLPGPVVRPRRRARRSIRRRGGCRGSWPARPRALARLLAALLARVRRAVRRDGGASPRTRLHRRRHPLATP